MLLLRGKKMVKVDSVLTASVSNGYFVSRFTITSARLQQSRAIHHNISKCI